MVWTMSEILKRRIKQRADFDSPVNEGILNLIVAADHVRSIHERTCSEYGITPAQYNVLRILRGAGADGHPRCEIAERMVERAPDVTRLVDRLEKEGLVIRERSDDDKRQSITRITEKGLRLLDAMQPSVDETMGAVGSKASLAEWIALSNVCEKIYNNEV
jgi:DNA-binding MarR family transcriptional regulator